MRVLVLFERSAIVRDKFRSRGCDAWSCDLKPCEGDARWHYQGDAFVVFAQYGPWDLVIAHPECTDLAVSGALHFRVKKADGRQQAAIDVFMRVADLPVEKLCIENPVSIMSTVWRKPDQIIQPYQLGDDASKKTCLWLRGLPPLVIDPAQYVEPRMVCACGRVYAYDLEFSSGCPQCGPGHAKPRWANQCDSGQNKLGPSDHRAMDRARTYPGIAEAFTQWITPVTFQRRLI